MLFQDGNTKHKTFLPAATTASGVAQSHVSPDGLLPPHSANLRYCLRFQLVKANCTQLRNTILLQPWAAKTLSPRPRARGEVTPRSRSRETPVRCYYSTPPSGWKMEKCHYTSQVNNTHIYFAAEATDMLFLDSANENVAGCLARREEREHCWQPLAPSKGQ